MTHDTEAQTTLVLPDQVFKPTVLRVMDLVEKTLQDYHDRKIHLTIRQKREIRWTPRYNIGRPSCTQSRPYTKMSLAEYLNDVENAGVGVKAGENTSLALDLLAGIERGVVGRERIESLAYSGIAFREFKKLRKALAEK